MSVLIRYASVGIKDESECEIAMFAETKNQTTRIKISGY